MNRPIFYILVLLIVSCTSKNPEKKTVSQSEDTKVEMANENLSNISFQVDGMTCEIGCAARIKKKVASMEGVALSKVNFEAKTAYISFDPATTSFENRLKIFGKGTQRINESTYEDKEKDVLGSCVTLIGNSPSNLHFFATDTKRHFISGSLLFSAAPNYDSLAPAIGYIRNDVQKMLETLRWQ